jgi:hypothetical protein
MTATEDRLTDALRAVADAISDESLRPLTAAIPGQAAARPRPSAVRWLTPVAAAVSVLAIVGLIAAVTWPKARQPTPSFRDSGTATAPPPYYVTIQGQNADVLRVHPTSGGDSGSVSDVVDPPRGWYATGANSSAQAYAPAAVAAAGDRVFVVAYNNQVTRQTGLFRFGLTKAGKVTDFAMVPGGALPGMTNPTLAVSPDGSRVAVAGTPDAGTVSADPVEPPSIIVVDLRTGARRVWRGGLARPGWQLSIPSVSWTQDGKTLVLVAQWCRPNLSTPQTALCADETGTAVPTAGPVGQLETLSVTGGGGRLSAGRVIWRGSARYPTILQAVAVPGGEVVALVAHGTHPYLVRLRLAGGQITQVYDGNPVAGETISLGLYSAALTVDASGRYFVITINLGVPTGWVADGVFHYVGQGTIVSAAW